MNLYAAEGCWLWEEIIGQVERGNISSFYKPHSYELWVASNIAIYPHTCLQLQLDWIVDTIVAS